jgi:glycosyltransferase involved in cell wall biosynthesis
VSGTYNRLPYLQKMVLSVRNSFVGVFGLGYEIVLVDGGSTDTTQEWCKLQPDIRLIEHGKLVGAVKAFNDGAYAATGKYVIMANDDIEFVGTSILSAYAYMETHPNCGGGCFYQDRDGRDWHVDGMQAVRVTGAGRSRKVDRVHVYYAQVGIFPKWLGDQVGWWCDELEYGRYLKDKNYGPQIGLHTYGGDNELSAKIIDLGFTVDPILPTEPLAKISDKEADDDLRQINNIDGAHDPKAIRGGHPDSFKFGQKWINRNAILGISGYYPGPILKDKPMISNPLPEPIKERVLYLPLFEQGWQVQKEQKRGLRDALARIANVVEYDYMSKYHAIGKSAMMAELHDICKEFRPTVFISQLHNSDQISGDDIGSLRNACSGCRFVNWNGDYWPDQLLDERGLILANSFDLMTCINRDVVRQHQAAGINTRYWQIGWEPDGCDHQPTVFHDVVFLASGYSQKRQRLGVFLIAYGTKEMSKVGLYGSGWGDAAKGENLYNFKEACKIYRGAKLAIGDSQWPESGFVSNRIFQILAAGNCVLCHQWFRDYQELGLVDSVNCIIWKDQADLAQKLKYWLAPVNADRLKEISAAGEQLALNRHSFDSRVVKEWIKGTPPDNIFFQTWWVWDGENIFLAHWKRDSNRWEQAATSFFEFKPEKVTHYQALSMPDITHVGNKNDIR